MSTIKFYTIEEWVYAYLKEWGYHDSALTARLSNELLKQKKSLQPDEIVKILNQKIMDQIGNYLQGDRLNDLQKLNYFKMIFLTHHLSLKYSLFENLSENSKEELSHYFHQFLAAPDLILSDMHRQSIKTYHPLWRLKKTFAKGVKAVVHSVKKK